MGLFNKRTFGKAKKLADKNKDKIAAGVSKATAAIDEKTGGKHTDKLKKVDDAASKYAGSDPAAEGAGETAPDAGEARPSGEADPDVDAEADR